ncbi:MAG: acetyl-CoA acetyltransferase [Acidimicrobiales bacterium]
MSLPPATPLLVGVGTASADAEPVALMTEALVAAAEDAGAGSLLAAIGRLAVPQGTWRYPDPARLVAEAVGARHAVTVLGELGVSQQTLVGGALSAVADGRCEVAAVVGADARAWARRPGAAERRQDAVPDEVHRREPDFMAAAELSVGAGQPVVQYAMIDNALRHVDGLDPDAQRRQIDRLWGAFNAVAADNPAAAFPTPRPASWLGTPGPDNRPLAFPYLKWHASQWTVDQGAALLFCSAEAARRHGVPLDRAVVPLVAVEADHAVSLSRRRLLHRWPAMAVLGQAAERRLGRPLAEIELVEVYSCFPSAVRVQQRELGLDPALVPTLTGGMTFAGGPFNNFTYQATAAMVGRLREQPGALGLVTTVCGLLTKPGLAVWSTLPDGAPPLVADLAEAARAATPQCEVLDDHHGPATVATYTVTYDGLAPARTVVIADVDGGRRCLAASDDRALAEEATRRELIGTTVVVDGRTFTV